LAKSDLKRIKMSFSKTEEQYNQVINICRDLFNNKTKDYGTSWRILRLPSITDQIFIKAQRIRSIQEKGTQKVADGIRSEFIGIINYCVIALIQMELSNDEDQNLVPEKVAKLFDVHIANNLELLKNKNHDYGEAWRDMRVSSMTDLILMKIFRVKQIEDNAGKTIISEGVAANYQDMLNYAVFCLIKLDEV